ncbi:MAG: hypothetical protein ACR2HE_03365 [Casimicrobiaceae bacterium]
MKLFPLRFAAAGAIFAAAMLVADAHAARVGILSNLHASETATDFGAQIPGHTFTAVDTLAGVPSLASLTSAFDVLLVFEDGTYPGATAVGNVVAAFANTGRAVVLGTFYEQDRSDGPPVNSPHSWGLLETIDPNTTDGEGTPYVPRTLNFASLVAHPLTAGITSLSSGRFAGGNQAKLGTIVVGTWTQPNARGLSDPAIAYRVTGSACVIHVAIAPSYPTIGVAGTEFGGDFHRLWGNAFDFGAAGCIVSVGSPGVGLNPAAIPTLNAWGLALTILLIAGATVVRRRR